MRRLRLPVSICLCLAAASGRATGSLPQELRAIAADARGTVSVSCALPHAALNCDLRATSRPPMQSVFKLPLGVAILHEVEIGRLSLDQPVRFRPEDRILPTVYSPLQDQYPAADVDVPLETLLRLTVALSDNVAADILLRLGGGPRAVDRYIASLGIRGFHLRDDEAVLHHQQLAQYRNWFEPRAAVQFLRKLSDDSPLTPAHTERLLQWMTPEQRTSRLEAELPVGVRVPHKSGSSDVDNGLARATNDIGLLPLPDGRRIAIAVFVTDSRADQDTREKVIARIGKAVYDAGIRAP